jgi:hypothetical protein
MAPGDRRGYLGGMHPHQVGSLVAVGVSMFCAAVAIFIVMLNARRSQSRDFDFAASARRIRAMPVPPKDDV